MKTVSTSYHLSAEDQAEIRNFVAECRRIFGRTGRVENVTMKISTARTST
jgi:hypothetical protein